MGSHKEYAKIIDYSQSRDYVQFLTAAYRVQHLKDLVVPLHVINPGLQSPFS